MAEIKLKNSFLDVSAKGQKVLVIVPHEDDEINVAGSVMYSYVQLCSERGRRLLRLYDEW